MTDPFDALIEVLQPRLTRALVATYGVERGEEALAEALAYAWEHRGRLLEMENPGGYLYRVGQSRSRPRVVDANAFPRPQELGIPHVEPELGAALGELTERQRVCVALVVGHHWTLHEAAELLGITKTSVQSHVERGLARLRARLGVADDVGA